MAEESGQALVVLLLCVSGKKGEDLPTSKAEDIGRKTSPLDCAVDGTTDGSKGVFRGDDIFAGDLPALLSVMGLDDDVDLSA